MNDPLALSRGSALRFLFILPTLAAALAAPTAAKAKARKDEFEYQDKPNGKNRCGKCSSFQPGKSSDSKGSCKIVDGEISPNGWCIAFSPKS